MKLPFLLLSLSAPLLAQGLPRNIEMSLHADTTGVWVVNAEGQITRIRDSGAKEGNYRTWEPPAGKLVNPQADYPVWKGASHRGRTLFPVASTDARGAGLLQGFWKSDASGEGVILAEAVTGPVRPVPDRWIPLQDTLLGMADSSQVLWQLDGNDSLTALGLAANGMLVNVARCGACSLADSLKARAKDTLQTIQGIDLAGDTLLLATTGGLWKGRQILSRVGHPSLGRGNVLGVWAGAGGIYAQTDSTLWYLPSLNSMPRQIRGDSALAVDHRIAALAWSGDTAWALLRTASYGLPGLVGLHQGKVLSRGGKTPTLLDAEDGLPFSSEVNLSDLVLSPATATSPARIWVASRGEGVAWTTPGSGRWTLLRHQSPLNSGLKEVRVIPTRLESGSSLIAYSLSKPGNVTIEIFNGAMEPVRTVIKGAYRSGDPLRYENAISDRWDGCTDGGKLAAIGLYYVRVKSGSQTGWGKVFQLKGGSTCGQ